MWSCGPCSLDANNPDRLSPQPQGGTRQATRGSAERDASRLDRSHHDLTTGCLLWTVTTPGRPIRCKAELNLVTCLTDASLPPLELQISTALSTSLSPELGTDGVRNGR